ncbi:elongator complex protein 4 isoform X3 [Phyllobates terribilis]|uniref:elongator complex protein 4 isoform X3 n=1 Tax=Phyllobates terribilis TaxID=111132 RepID=UPI003CCA8FDF
MAAPGGRGVSAAALAETSFRRKVRGKLPAIRGTRPSVHNGQLLVSTGVPAMDHVLGGGLAVGTLLLIEEDTYSTYSNLLLKYFLAEGVISGHEVFIASASDVPCKIIQDLPAPLTDEIPTPDDAKNVSGGPGSEETMKIAWRYQNLPKFESVPLSSARFGHYYDMSKTMSPDMLQSAKTHSFYLPNIVPLDETYGLSSETTCDYIQLLQSVQSAVHQGSFDGSNPQNKAIISRVRNLSDTVVGLESFIGSERESNPLYKDYHGLFLVHKIPRLNSLISDVSDTKDLAFKLKRKMFSIERLHLPPDLSDTVSRSSKQDLAGSTKLLSSGCGSTAAGKKHLDF